MSYTPQNKVRIVTAAALFDGHDAAINIMRRIMQAKGAEVIHLGHNRSAAEIVDCAIQEDAQGIAVTSYQGGHVEFFKYMYDLLQQKGCGHIKIFGGGGGTILPVEIEELHAYGIARLYSPDDGRQMGLEGMIEDLIQQCDIAIKPLPAGSNVEDIPQLRKDKNPKIIARAISLAENDIPVALLSGQKARAAVTVDEAAGARITSTSGEPEKSPVLGITGTGGAGKSSVTDELVRRFLNHTTDKTVAVISVDPSKKKTGGALLGDRIRMNSIHHPRAYMRSLATRESDKAISEHIQEAIDICKLAAYDFIILETSGIGQSDTAITDYCDVSLYVMTPEYGAASQLEKINMLDYADVIAINKFDKAGALDALHDVRKQYKRNHNLWNAKEEELPVVGSIASQFNDAGINLLYEKVMEKVTEKAGISFGPMLHESIKSTATKSQIIPPARVRYLAEIAEAIGDYGSWVNEQCKLATQLYQVTGVAALQPSQAAALADIKVHLEKALHPECKKLLEEWPALVKKYTADFYEFQVRDKVIKLPLYSKSLSHSRIPKVSLPKYNDWGDILRWQLTENLPGEFPYAAGVFPLKREGEDPTRMFAGEGGPERTNKRFHYVSLDQPAKRLSTAFDSVTLYGEDPAVRPDIYGKVGNSGVSIATVDDAKKLYSGFDLCDPKTSVSMTINGPAPILLAFFMNAAIDQQCEKYIKEQGLTEKVKSLITQKFKDHPLPHYNGDLPAGNDGLGLQLLGISGEEVLDREVYEKIKAHALSTVRGTVQADILKEDQAQNTCIFSTEFALKLMGDVQEYFITQKVRNFYSVSISGYHIAEAGANPITQLAFTLANGFTYVEYYLSRGMNIDDFAPNLSFFFSNGMDPEYAVIGRVARRIWAKAIKYKYKGNDRSQKLKYHIQTSGRSLHAQEIDFNDIRTTLQALYAIYDNCNSLHTNAYDEAITTPTEESVRRAMAIQLIINRELGTAKNENPVQGSFFIEELTELVEEAVLAEFNRITERGGVLGAMERMYQRNKIQEESLYYESLKHTGEFPIVGVNTFLNKNGSPTIIPAEVIRSTTEEKEFQIHTLEAFQRRHEHKSEAALKHLQQVAVNNGNLFAELMETVKHCSLGQITHALYEVGGQYRRNM
ncbi:methylmalonyl-CoA mutase [Chitinophaga polysaccharea]|uniref:Fused isobutyryl-CoA mutase n=1 Tax=Chitinophaga polysaccharea TaxID=1293035 RepID=A0A561Q215_9BACT|nr:methylmalonyl-CoA mutase family protein [Chitinophaga polysaccharea]TWF44359.1 methylmalonyl-CoA mutase [Chitinophaga polysaccharea]